jgi:NAD-dependent dihydropyrimidine dehydrogenase PreA subunit
MPTALNRVTVPVIVNEEKCIADKGCTVCVDVCPLDLLAIDLLKGKAYMKFDECWYCMPCEVDCPTQAISVSIPYLLR